MYAEVLQHHGTRCVKPIRLVSVSVSLLACDFNIVVTLLMALVGVGKVGTRVYCHLYTQRLYQTSKEYKTYWIYRVLLNAEEV